MARQHQQQPGNSESRPQTPPPPAEPETVGVRPGLVFSVSHKPASVSESLEALNGGWVGRNQGHSMSKSRQAGRSSSQAERSGESSFLLTHRSTWGMQHHSKELSNLSNEVFKNICCRQVAFLKCVHLYSLSSLNLNVEFFCLAPRPRPLCFERPLDCASQVSPSRTALRRLAYLSIWFSSSFWCCWGKKQGRDCYPRGALSFSATRMTQSLPILLVTHRMVCLWVRASPRKSTALSSYLSHRLCGAPVKAKSPPKPGRGAKKDELHVGLRKQMRVEA